MPAALVPAARPASFLEESAEDQARFFLGNHVDKPVQQDELAELKGQNPHAYALVKALLTKRSLGLLNLRHPTAHFAPVSAKQQHAAEQHAKVYPNMPRSEELEASNAHHHSKVLFAVAGSKGDKKTGFLSMGSPPPPLKTAASVSAPQRKVVAPAVNAKRVSQVQASSTDLLASFSWDDSNPKSNTAAQLNNYLSEKIIIPEAPEMMDRSKASSSPLSRVANTALLDASSQPAGRDWLNWRREDDDDLMVQNIVSGVAEHKGSVKTGLISTESAPAAPKAAATPAPQIAKVAGHQGGVQTGVHSTESPPRPPVAADIAPAPQQKSYSSAKIPTSKALEKTEKPKTISLPATQTQVTKVVELKGKMKVGAGSPPLAPKAAAAAQAPQQNSGLTAKIRSPEAHVKTGKPKAISSPAKHVAKVAELKGGMKAGTEFPRPPPKTADTAPAPQQNSHLRAKIHTPETLEKTERSNRTSPPAPQNAKVDLVYASVLAELKGGVKTGLGSMESPPPRAKAAAMAPAPQPKVATPAAIAKRASQVQASPTNYLASFKWDDPKPVPKKTNAKKSSLMAWLVDTAATGTPAASRGTNAAKEAPTPQAAPAEVAKPENPYLLDLN